MQQWRHHYCSGHAHVYTIRALRTCTHTNAPQLACLMSSYIQQQRTQRIRPNDAAFAATPTHARASLGAATVCARAAAVQLSGGHVLPAAMAAPPVAASAAPARSRSTCGAPGLLIMRKLVLLTACALLAGADGQSARSAARWTDAGSSRRTRECIPLYTLTPCPACYLRSRCG